MIESIKKNKWVRSCHFWRNFIDLMINKEFNKIEGFFSDVKMDIKNNEGVPKNALKKVSEVMYSQMLPYINNMMELEIDKRLITKVIDEFLQKYNYLDEGSIEVIFSLVCTNGENVDDLRKQYKNLKETECETISKKEEIKKENAKSEYQKEEKIKEFSEPLKKDFINVKNRKEIVQNQEVLLKDIPKKERIKMEASKKEETIKENNINETIKEKIPDKEAIKKEEEKKCGIKNEILSKEQNKKEIPKENILNKKNSIKSNKEEKKENNNDKLNNILITTKESRHSFPTGKHCPQNNNQGPINIFDIKKGLKKVENNPMKDIKK